MTKNSKIAIIVSVFAVIVLIVVLSSTVFSIHRAQVIWYNTPNSTLNKLSDDNALSISQAKSKSVFLFDRKNAISNLEKNYPELRVVNLEVQWPNILKIHAVQREQVYALLVADGKYAIVDQYFKVLDTTTSFTTEKNNAILLNTEEFKNQVVSKGDVLDIFGKEVYLNTYNAFIELSRTLADMRAIISSASLDQNTLSLETFFGLKIKIDKPFANTCKKMRLAIKTFDLLTAEDYNNKTIEIFVNSNNQLEARYY